MGFAQAQPGTSPAVNHLGFSEDGLVMLVSRSSMVVECRSKGRLIWERNLTSTNERARPFDRIKGLLVVDDRFAIVTATDKVFTLELETGGILSELEAKRSFGFLLNEARSTCQLKDGSLMSTFNSGDTAFFQAGSSIIRWARLEDGPNELAVDSRGRVIGRDDFSVGLWDLESRTRSSVFRSEDRVTAVAAADVIAVRTMSRVHFLDENLQPFASADSAPGLPRMTFFAHGTKLAISGINYVALFSSTGESIGRMQVSEGRIVGLGTSPSGELWVGDSYGDFSNWTP